MCSDEATPPVPPHSDSYYKRTNPWLNGKNNLTQKPNLPNLIPQQIQDELQGIDQKKLTSPAFQIPVDEYPTVEEYRAQNNNIHLDINAPPVPRHGKPDLSLPQQKYVIENAKRQYDQNQKEQRSRVSSGNDSGISSLSESEQTPSLDKIITEMKKSYPGLSKTTKLDGKVDKHDCHKLAEPNPKTEMQAVTANVDAELAEFLQSTQQSMKDNIAKVDKELAGLDSLQKTQIGNSNTPPTKSSLPTNWTELENHRRQNSGPTNVIN